MIIRRILPLSEERLFELGDLNRNSGSDIFDESLQNAVKSFQTDME